MADDDARSLEELLLDMKNTSELMVDLAYSALLYDNRDIASEVFDLEDDIDDTLQVLQRKALARHKAGGVTMDEALATIRLGEATEIIADSAAAIADAVLRDVSVHPIFQASMRESDVIFARAEVQEGSAMDGQTLGGAHLATETGMWVIAVRRGPRWIYGPGRGTRLRAGDVLIARGPEDGEPQLRKLVGLPPAPGEA